MAMDSMRRTARRALVVALWLAPVVDASAQGATPTAPGTRVRVTVRGANPERTTGTFVAIVGDSMRYTPDGDSVTRVVPLARMTQLEVGRGLHRHTRQGLLTGEAIGVLTGVVAGYASGDDPKEGFVSFTRSDKAAILGAAFGVVGAGIGTIIGFVDRSERWQRVRPPYAVTVRPGRGGMRVAMRVAMRIAF